MEPCNTVETTLEKIAIHLLLELKENENIFIFQQIEYPRNCMFLRNYMLMPFA